MLKDSLNKRRLFEKKNSMTRAICFLKDSPNKSKIFEKESSMTRTIGVGVVVSVVAGK